MNEDQSKFMSKMQGEAVNSFGTQRREDFTDEQAYNKAHDKIKALGNSQSNQSSKQKNEMYGQFMEELLQLAGGNQGQTGLDGSLDKSMGKLPQMPSQPGNSQDSLQQITNVFYNMLNKIADEKNSDQLRDLASEMK